MQRGEERLYDSDDVSHYWAATARHSQRGPLAQLLTYNPQDLLDEAALPEQVL